MRIRSLRSRARLLSLCLCCLSLASNAFAQQSGSGVLPGRSAAGGVYTGTLDQVIVTGTVLSLPQSIGTSSSPSFANLLLGGAPASLAPLTVGARNVNNSVDAAVVVSRLVTDSVAGNGHSFSDSSSIDRAGTIGYNSFDGRITLIGANTYDHYAAFQAAPTMQGSGTVNAYYGLAVALLQSSGTTTVYTGLNFTNATGAGTVGSQRAINVEALTKGSSNYAFISQGAGKFYLSDTTDAVSGAVNAFFMGGGAYVTKKIITPSTMQAAYFASTAVSALTITSNTIVPTSTLHQVGAGLIKTITVPAGCAPTCVIYIEPTAAYTYDATGNILVPVGGGVALISKLMPIAWNGTKWVPGY